MWMPESKVVRKVLHDFNTDLDLDLMPEPLNDLETSDPFDPYTEGDRKFWVAVQAMQVHH